MATVPAHQLDHEGDTIDREDTPYVQQEPPTEVDDVSLGDEDAGERHISTPVSETPRGDADLPNSLEELQQILAEEQRRHSILQAQKDIRTLRATNEALERRLFDPSPPRHLPSRKRAASHQLERADTLSSLSDSIPLDDIRSPGTERGRPKDIPMYEGKTLEEHQSWIRDCEARFRLFPVTFGTTRYRILWSAQFLKGIPKARFLEALDAQEFDENTLTWEEYSTFLEDLVVDPANRGILEVVKFTNARQGDRQSAQAFDSELAALEAKLPRKEESLKARDYLARLRQDLQQAIMSAPNIPFTRRELVALATRLEQNLPRLRGNNSSTDTPTTGNRDRQKRADPPRGPGGSKSFPRNQNLYCTRCKRQGHQLSNCFSTRNHEGNRLTDRPPRERPPGLGQREIASVQATKNKSAP